MLPGQLSINFTPQPILDAVERYRGTFHDLESGTSVSPDSLARARESLSTQLAKRGLGYGDRAVMAVANGPLFITTLAAILSRGASPLLLHAKTPPAEMLRAARRYGARLILHDGVTEEEFRSAALEPVPLSCESWGQLLAADVAVGDIDYAGSKLTLPGVPLHPTSGTTGKPKVALRHGIAAVAEAQHYIETSGINAADAILVTPPMSHAYCYGMGVMVPMLSGASVVSMRSFRPTLVKQALNSRQVSVFPAVPAILASLQFGAAEDLFAGVRIVFSAGAPLAEKTAQGFLRRFGKAIRPLYGTTETGGIAISPAGEAATSGCCVGPPMRGVHVDVRQSDSEIGLGKLFVHSESMMAGYLDADGFDASQLEGGWFNTGDLSWLDERGQIHLRGRVAEVINVAGMKVVPSEVEDVIAALPGVLEVKVYARERRSGSNAVRVAIVPSNGITEAEIRAHCEKNLVYYKRPDTISLLEALPRNPAGKIAADQLP